MPGTAQHPPVVVVVARNVTAIYPACAAHLKLAACCLVSNGLSCSRWPVVLDGLASAGVTATPATGGAEPCQPFKRWASGQYWIHPPAALAVQHVQHNQTHATRNSANPMRCCLLHDLSCLYTETVKDKALSLAAGTDLESPPHVELTHPVVQHRGGTHHQHRPPDCTVGISNVILLLLVLINQLLLLQPLLLPVSPVGGKAAGQAVLCGALLAQQSRNEGDRLRTHTEAQLR